MEKTRNKIILSLCIVIALLIFVPATIYMIKSHKDAMYLVVEKKVKEAAELCYNEEKCDNKIISLKDLIDKNYLDKIYDPITKELINLDSYVDLENDKFEIVK